MRNRIGAFCRAGLALVIGCTLSGSAHASADPFAPLLQAGSDEALRIEPSARTLRLGQTLDFRIRAETEGYLTVLQLDAHGGVRILTPEPGAPPRWIRPGETESLRDVSVGGPVGPARAYAFATATPLVFASDAPLRTERRRLGRSTAQTLAERARSAVAEGGAVGGTDLRVRGGRQLEYTVDEIVEQLTPTRSIRRPRIDFHHVLFGFDSAVLTDLAKQNLDVLGEALSTPDLREERFILAGHTDDVGRAAYNQGLSERRAGAARRYLADTWDVGDRIEVRGYGEARPLEAAETPEARRMNRRVELEVIR